MTRFLSTRWFQSLILFALLAGAIAIRVAEPTLVIRLRHLTFDFYNRVLPRPVTDTVVIIDIDETSLQKYGQWPWPRPKVGQLVLKLKELGAQSIAFDMVFAEDDRTSPARIAQSLPDKPELSGIKNALKDMPDNDETFAVMLEKVGNVVAGFVATDKKTDRIPVNKALWEQAVWTPKADPRLYINSYADFATNLPVIQEAVAGSGAFNPEQDADGIIRKVPLIVGGWSRKEGKVTTRYPALAIEAIRVALGEKTIKIHNSDGDGVHLPGISALQIGPYVVPTERDGKAWVYFSGFRKSRYIPAWEILEGHAEKNRIDGKIVFIGTSAIGLKDLRATPLGQTALPGVDVHAELTEQILAGQHLSRPDYISGLEIISMAFLCLLMIFLMPFIGALTMALLGVFLIWGGTIGSIYVYNTQGLLIDPVYPAIAIAFIYAASSLLMNLRTEVEKRAVRHAFAHYISPAFMEELAKNPESLRLGGQTRDLTIMFTDIRGFTSIAESMEPGELITLINDFLTPMSSQVLDNRGTIDKYMGDAMMAFWNAPLPDENHARHACAAALGMADALAPINARLEQRAKEKNVPFVPLRAGIGLNTGPCAVGNMGSRQRFAYSALGDAVNLASRLESQTKLYGVPIILSEITRRAAPDFAAVELDLIQVKGRAEPVHIYALLGDSALAQTEGFRAFEQAQSEMLAFYRAKNFEQSRQSLDKALKHSQGLVAFDVFHALYRERLSAPPPADAGWRGVFVAQNK